MRLWATCQRFVSHRNPSWRHNFRSILVFFQLNNKSQDSTAAPARICLTICVFMCFTSRRCKARCILLIVCYRWNSHMKEWLLKMQLFFYLDCWHIFQLVPREGSNSVCWHSYCCIHKQSDVGKFRISAPVAFNSVSNWNVSMTSQEFRMLLSNVYDENRGIDLLSDRGFRQFYDWSPSDWCICFPLIWSCRMVW